MKKVPVTAHKPRQEIFVPKRKAQSVQPLPPKQLVPQNYQAYDSYQIVDANFSQRLTIGISIGCLCLAVIMAAMALNYEPKMQQQAGISEAMLDAKLNDAFSQHYANAPAPVTKQAPIIIQNNTAPTGFWPFIFPIFGYAPQAPQVAPVLRQPQAAIAPPAARYNQQQPYSASRRQQAPLVTNKVAPSARVARNEQQQLMQDTISNYQQVLRD